MIDIMKKITFAAWMVMCMMLFPGCDNTTSDKQQKPIVAETQKIPEKVWRNYMKEGGVLELPVNGATGFASVVMDLRSEADNSSVSIGRLPVGTAFRIIREHGEWWLVEYGKLRGWVPHQFCLINLPDVVPSIVYDVTNTYSSCLRSSGKVLPGITGNALYQATGWNQRFGEQQYIVPVIYSMAEKICAAQQNALKNGNTLKIYEAYRPFDIQQRIVNSLRELAKTDSEVKRGINTPPWGMNWFIATTRSNHQIGVAIDVSLARVITERRGESGDFSFRKIAVAEEYKMPTPIHELSAASAAFAVPISSKSDTLWRQTASAPGMNQAALNLQKYCTESGLSPLASEWWHFNDLEAYAQTQNYRSKGNFHATEIFSSMPQD